ncbi:hypothetical protein C0583_01210 [Candidatus Parcubacteria bacterium]|nr:MAG: hypothetical protein C0583_01210 [Candidatus Parcubacteria bacterium]
MKLKKKLKKVFLNNWQIMVVIFVCSGFFLATASFSYYVHDYSDNPAKKPDFVKWLSPDETANYIFAKLFAQTGKLILEESYNVIADDIMRPRSFRSDNGEIKPVSFLGIILIYGSIAKIFSYKIIPYLTPLLASIGIFYFYLFVSKIFGKNIAFISAILLSFFPPLVYYTARSMFHNVLFTMLSLVSLFYLYLVAEKHKPIKRIKNLYSNKFFESYIYAVLAGIFFGLAAITRTSELLWLLPMVVVLYIFNVKKVGFIKPVIFLIFVFVAMTPMFYFNHKLYGSYYFGGYPEMNESISTLAKSGSELISIESVGNFERLKSILKTIKNTIFHFGYDYEQSKLMFGKYFKEMFSYLYWGAVIGFVLFLFAYKKIKYKHLVYIIFYSFISFILVSYYGSWEFFDNPDKAAVTIGNSYTRYWLPVYMGAIPFLAVLIVKFSNIINLILKVRVIEEDEDGDNDQEQVSLFSESRKTVYSKNALRFIIVSVFAVYFAHFVLYGSEEGLIVTAKNAKAMESEWSKVLELTEENSVIVTRYHDKLFFPERKVVVGLFNDIEMNDRYAVLANELPIYYYNFSFRDVDLEYLNERRLAESGLGIELVAEINDKFSLYRLFLVNNNEVN